MQVIFWGLLSPLSSNAQYASCWICHVLCALSPALNAPGFSTNLIFAPPPPWTYGGCCLWRGRILWLSNSRGYSVSCRGLLAVLRGWSVMPPMHLRDKVCKGFLLVAQLLLRPPLLDGGYFLRSPGYVSCRSFLQERNTCVEFLLLQRWQPGQALLGEKVILDGFFDIGDSPSVPCLLNLGGIALGMTLDCDFLQCLLVYSEEFSNLCISIGNNVRFYPFFKDWAHTPEGWHIVEVFWFYFKGCSINYGIKNVQKKVLTFWSLFVS